MSQIHKVLFSVVFFDRENFLEGDTNIHVWNELKYLIKMKSIDFKSKPFNCYDVLNVLHKVLCLL